MRVPSVHVSRMLPDLAEKVRAQARRRTRREFWLFFILPAIVVALGAFAFAFRYVDPAPPRKVSMATGLPDGYYDRIGKQYREILAREGIEVELRPSGGAVENLELLQREDDPVDIALVQGGALEGEPPDDLLSLGSVAVEAVWLFERVRPKMQPITRLADLKGLRVAIGAPGSGNLQLARLLLRDAGIEDADATLLPIGGVAIQIALEEGRIDAALVVGSADAQLVRKIAAMPGIRIAPLDHVDAYVRRYGFLHPVVLPRGVFDTRRDVPPQDVRLLATTANLVVRDDLHPAIVDLLMVAAAEAHGDRGVFADEHEYPKATELVVPLHEQAARFYKSGRPVLQRYLPFWIATWLDRMAVLLLPLVAIVLPAMRVIPALWQWRIKRRIFRHYSDLGRIEAQADQHPGAEVLDTLAQELDAIEHRIATLPVHWIYGDLVYGLRSHLSIVRGRIEAIRHADAAAGDAGSASVTAPAPS